MLHGGVSRHGGKGDASGGTHVWNPCPPKDKPHTIFSIVQNRVYSGQGEES